MRCRVGDVRDGFQSREARYYRIVEQRDLDMNLMSFLSDDFPADQMNGYARI